MALLLFLWKLFEDRARQVVPRGLRVLPGMCHLGITSPAVDVQQVIQMLTLRGHQARETWPMGWEWNGYAWRRGYRFFDVVYWHDDTLFYPSGVVLTPRRCPPNTPRTPE